MELSKIVCPRSKKFGVAVGDGEVDQWPRLRIGWGQIMKDLRCGLSVPTTIVLFSFPCLKNLSPLFANVTYF